MIYPDDWRLGAITDPDWDIYRNWFAFEQELEDRGEMVLMLLQKNGKTTWAVHLDCADIVAPHDSLTWRDRFTSWAKPTEHGIRQGSGR